MLPNERAGSKTRCDLWYSSRDVSRDRSGRQTEGKLFSLDRSFVVLSKENSQRTAKKRTFLIGQPQKNATWEEQSVIKRMGEIVLCDVVQGDYCLICVSTVLLHHLRLLSYHLNWNETICHITFWIGLCCNMASVLSFPGFRGCITVIISHYIHTTDDYWSEIS